MREIFQGCLDERKIPQEWKDVDLVSLYKGKKSASECNNYRGISLLSVLGKCFSHILVQRLTTLTDNDLLDYQFGLRAFRGTELATGVLQRLI